MAPAGYDAVGSGLVLFTLTLLPGGMIGLPLHQLPDLGLQLAFLADLGEDGHGLLEMVHRFLRPAGGVQ